KRVIEPPVPSVTEVKVESKRAIEPPVTTPVPKTPAPEIVSEPEKPGAVVSPKVAKTREEKKAVAKPPVSPPPVEKPAFVTPKVMPPPQVPATRPRSADVEEEPQVWDARKLKPIGIGIAALLAISLSFVARTVLWPVKPRMVIAKQPSSSPQPIAATRETAAPTIVATTESAPPALTNAPSGPEAAPSGASQNQTTEPAALTSTNPATAPNATQNVAPPNQQPATNVGAAQSAAHTQPAQPPF